MEILDYHTIQIATVMYHQGFTASPEQLRTFILDSIPGRERAKFEFMKSVDVALEDIANLASDLDLSRDDMSFLPVDPLIRSAQESSSAAVRTEFRRSVEFNRKRWSLTCGIRLPHLVRSTDDLVAFEEVEWTPNFISSQRVVGRPALLEGREPPPSLEGRIALIRAADPGYDWIFSHPIAGLITEFGGVASHMAIRAAEFGLPAAIGCGEAIFSRLSSASLIELDCTNKRVNLSHESRRYDAYCRGRQLRRGTRRHKP